MFAVAAFCIWVIAYVVTSGADTRVGETAVLSAFLTLAAIVGSYVFGAVWQDVSMDRNRAEYSAYGNMDATPLSLDDRPR